MEMRADSPQNAASLNYTSSLTLAQILYGYNLAEWIATKRPNVTLQRQSTGPVTFPRPGSALERNFTIVKAPMGSGKTAALIEWLRCTLQRTDANVLVVSCRRSFTQTLTKRLHDAGLHDFNTYFDCPEYIIRETKYRRLLVQAESLHRIGKSLLDSYDILILDEAMSIIAQLFSPTMRKTKTVDDTLTRLLTRCIKVLAMDATINSQMIDTCCELRGDENVSVIIGEYATDGFAERRCIILRKLGAETMANALLRSHGEAPIESSRNLERSLSPDESRTSGNGKPITLPCHQSQINRETFLYELRRRIMGGLNVCVFSSTMVFSELTKAFCLTLTDSVLLLNSQTKELPDVAEWAKYKVVIFTTVVTVGLSFDVPYFHSMFAYIKPSNYGPDMVSVYQSLGRVRTLLLNELIIYLDGSSSRDEYLFTPMLLNEVLTSGPGGWPTTFIQVTKATCCAFQRDCTTAFRDADNLYLYRKFKYKHLFERCTLSSTADSLNILQCLLEANYVTVTFSGCVPDENGYITADAFQQLLRDLRSDSRISQRTLRGIKDFIIGSMTSIFPIHDDQNTLKYKIDTEAVITGIIYDSEDACAFIDKYLKSGLPILDIKCLLRHMKDPVFREKFINTVILEMCLSVPIDRRRDEIFDLAKQIYTAGPIPYLNDDGSLGMAEAITDCNPSSRRNAYRSCSLILDSLNWRPTCDIDAGCIDMTPELINSAIVDYRESLRLALLEMPRLYTTTETLANSRSARYVAATLKGTMSEDMHIKFQKTLPETDVTRGAKSRLSKFLMLQDRESLTQNYSITLFKIFLEELFGAKIVKSTKTFPGSTKVKNLKKNDIEQLLDEIGIDRSELKTYKKLYTALMANKKAFAKTRYRIKRPKWYSWIKPASEARYECRTFFTSLLQTDTEIQYP